MSSELKIKFSDLSESEKQEFINWINNPQYDSDSDSDSDSDNEIPEDNIIEEEKREFMTGELDKYKKMT